MTVIKCRKKTPEVEAIQVTKDTLDEISIKIGYHASFFKEGYWIVSEDFYNCDIRCFSPEEFNRLFEPVPVTEEE